MYELGEDKLSGQVNPRKARGRFLEFCRYLRTLYPPDVRIAIICDNFSPHLTTRKDKRVGAWAAASNVEIAYTPTNSSWLNRVEAQFTALRYFALDGTDHATHHEQASMIRRYIIWRNNPCLRRATPPHHRPGKRSLTWLWAGWLLLCAGPATVRWQCPYLGTAGGRCGSPTSRPMPLARSMTWSC